MNEKPIIFSPDSIRAILKGRKTQTRRVVKPQPVAGLRWNSIVLNGYGGWTDGHGTPCPCPYRVGMRLWVRETWGVWGRFINGDGYCYRADGWDVSGVQWRSPIFMPRRASRLTLEIVSVRVERLQAITPEDVRAEGVDSPGSDNWQRAQTEAFARHWDAINAKRGFPWINNPWVWVLEFQKAPTVKQEEH